MSKPEEVDIANYEPEQLVELLSQTSRRTRQDAAHELGKRVVVDAQSLMPFVDQVVDALYRPEAQTRWECLFVLSELALINADAVGEAVSGAEESLFDEDNAMVRLNAFRFLARWGLSSEERAAIAWPLLDEAMQCYHGDSEYQSMLEVMAEFAAGAASEDVKKALVQRVSFDAQNASGYLKTFSARVVTAASK